MDLLPQPIAESPQSIEKEFFESSEWCDEYAPMGWPEHAAIIDSMAKDIHAKTIFILTGGDGLPF